MIDAGRLINNCTRPLNRSLKPLELVRGRLVVWDVLPMPLFESNDLFSLRRRPPQEKLVDQGFRQLSIALASIVGLVLVGILLTVLSGAHPVAYTHLSLPRNRKGYSSGGAG